MGPVMSAKSGLWNRFQSHTGGNVAIIFGISALFLVAVTGGAIDFSRINDARNKMQDAADIAVLRGALTASQGTTLSEKAADQAWIDNLNDADIIWPTSNHTGTLVKTVTGNVSKLSYNATATVKPIFLGFVGLGDAQTLTVSSTAQSEVNPFELALVLDTTGSMAQSSKMTNLKSSVTAVLNSLLDSSGKNSSNVKVGVVPFNTQTRMATSTSYAFVDYTACATNSDLGKVNYYLCRSVWRVYDAICTGATNQTTCLANAKTKMYYKSTTSNGVTTYDIQARSYEQIGSKYTLYTYNLKTYVDAATLKWVDVSFTNPTYSNQAKSYITTNYTNFAPSGYTLFNKATTVDWLVGVRSTWTGCLSDRNQSYDVSAAGFDASIPDSYYVAEPCDTPGMSTTMDMTTSISSVNTFVNTLASVGNTNITVGVQEGMELLSPNAPYTQGVAWGDPDMDKYMIVVTDGDNTQSRYSTNSSTIDKRTALACTAAKAKGITIFVVRVMDGNSSMLSTCATKTAYYYDLSSASQLSATMADIFLRIGKLRITQ